MFILLNDPIFHILNTFRFKQILVFVLTILCHLIIAEDYQYDITTIAKNAKTICPNKIFEM